MSENEIGLREGRAKFGDLVNRAEYAGQTTYITRHGRRVAAIVPAESTPQEPAMKKPAYAVTYPLRNGGEGIYAVYATEQLAAAVADTLDSDRAPEGVRRPGAHVMPTEVEQYMTVADYGTITDGQLNTLVIDPDGVYPWPGKVDADGWRRPTTEIK